MTITNQQFTAEESDFMKEAFEHQGAIKAGKAMRASIHSSMVRSAILVEKKKLWRALGYESFADYINNSGLFPFGTTTFYKLKERLEDEGDQRFDVLTAHRISQATRLELSEHGVEIELDGDEIVIQGKRVPADDKSAVTEAFKAVKRNLVLREHNETELKKNQEKLKKSNEEKDRRIANLINAQQHGLLTELNGYLQTFLSMKARFKSLTEATKELPRESKQRWRQQVFEGLSDLMLELSQAFELQGDGLRLVDPAPELTGDEETDYWQQGMHKATVESVLPEYEVEYDPNKKENSPISFGEWFEKEKETEEFNAVLDAYDDNRDDDDNDAELAASL